MSHLFILSDVSSNHGLVLVSSKSNCIKFIGTQSARCMGHKDRKDSKEEKKLGSTSTHKKERMNNF